MPVVRDALGRELRRGDVVVPFYDGFADRSAHHIREAEKSHRACVMYTDDEGGSFIRIATPTSKKQTSDSGYRFVKVAGHCEIKTARSIRPTTVPFVGRLDDDK